MKRKHWLIGVISFILAAALSGVYVCSALDEGFKWGQCVSCIGLILLMVLILNLNFKLRKGWAYVVMVLIPIGSFYLMEAYSHNAFVMYEPLQILNILFYFILFAFVFFIIGRACVAYIISLIFVMGVGIANYYTVCFRSSPILPWDLMSLETAFSVTSNYKFAIEFRMLIVALGFVVLMALATKLKVRLPKLNWKRIVKRLIGVAACVGCIFLMFFSLQMESVQRYLKLEETLFTPNHLYKTNGFMVSFLYDLQYIHVKEPKNYSVEAVQEIMDRYKLVDSEDELNLEEQPNVIVIMNEAFSDLAVLGDFETNQDYMPFIHNLTEDTVKGNMFVSVKGGNTANSEFEFLTGNTMAFLPQGSVAYQQYIHDEMPSLASWMGNLGYETAGLHPYYASGWDRDEVYPFLGFDTSVFLQDFKNRKKIRKYVSDASAYAEIIDMYEDKSKDQRLFAFEVTMQNHGGYYQDYDDFKHTIALEFEADSKSAQHYTEQYLSLIKESDRAFEELVNYFNAQEEKTVIVMFGDHQPADLIARPIQKLNGTYGDTTIEAEQDRFIVPFVIWANYDIEESYVEQVSINYLSALIMDAAQLPMTGYQKYLMDLYNKVPVITGNVYIGADGQYYTSKKNSPYADALKEYEMLQYYYIFEEDDSNAEFFGTLPLIAEE